MSKTTKEPLVSGSVPSDDTLGLLQLGTYLRRGKTSASMRQIFLDDGREGEAFYRDRWSHDKVVRSTHGVNCTGSCSWKVYVKDGIITWEEQQTDYPSTGPDMPAYEPRGCPRGAAFSWYTYSPTRVRYPYIRSVLLELWREALDAHPDPVEAWASIVEDPERARRYKSQRGKGGLVRASWDEVERLVAAAHVYTIKAYGPDRCAGFTVIPAMSTVSYGAGTRFYSLLGGTILSFYDWYADLPMASPQVFGDQTDVPESGDWFNAGYLMLWGSNVPVTRTPDAHFMTEVRYKGTKVVVISPDYADSTKFADEWLPVHPGTDGALGMAMGHVILKSFHVARREPFFLEYMKKYTDAPFLVSLEESEGAHLPGKFVTADDLADDPATAALASQANAAFKPVFLDTQGTVTVPNGSLGHRWGEADEGRWNLSLGDTDPLLSLLDAPAPDDEKVEVLLPRFDDAPEPGNEGTAHIGAGRVLRRGVPARRVAGRLVTTVYDLLLAQYGVERTGLPGSWPEGEDDASLACTPAWAEAITGVPQAVIRRVALEFAQNAIDTKGRSMIVMGAGINHYFHADTIYRSILALVAHAKGLLEDAGYFVSLGVHNMAEFGVPQERFRILMLAMRRPFRPPLGFLDRADFRTVREAIGALPPVAAGERHPDDPMHFTAGHKESTIATIRAVPKNGGSRPDHVGPDCLRRAKARNGRAVYEDVYGRLFWDRPAITVTAYVRNPASGRYVHPDQDRGLSVREAALLQSFPRNYDFAGSLDERFRQIGNAVPPAFAAFLAAHILDQLKAKVPASEFQRGITTSVGPSFSRLIPALKAGHRKTVVES
jgi:nitrate reductase alpha subunit